MLCQEATQLASELHRAIPELTAPLVSVRQMADQRMHLQELLRHKLAQLNNVLRRQTSMSLDVSSDHDAGASLQCEVFTTARPTDAFLL